MSEANVNTPAPLVQTQTDFQKWSKLPEDQRNGDQTSSATEAADEAAAAAKPDPASDPDKSSDQTQRKPAKEAQPEDADVPKGLQKRFKELTTKIKNLEAAAAARAAEAAKPAEPAKTEPAKADKAADGRPEQKDFETYDDYILALQDWRADQREAKRQQEAADRARETQEAERGRAWQSELAKARERHEDYDEVALSDLPINLATHNAIVEGGEDGAELAYYLGQHKDEAAEIFKMNPVRTTLALGKIIAGFRKSSDQTETRAVSRAPRPPKPVGSGITDTIGKEPDPTDYPKWSKWNAKREAALAEAD
jgi:hypothetical protein